MTGVKITDIQYKGGGPALAAIIAGECELGFQTPLAASGSCAEEVFDQSNTTWNSDRSLMTVQ